MIPIGGVVAAAAAAAARRRAEEESNSATCAVTFSSQGGSDMLEAKQVFEATFDYIKDERSEIKIRVSGSRGLKEVEVVEDVGFFSKKMAKVKTWREVDTRKFLSVQEGLKQCLPENAKVLNLVVDWHNHLVRVYYSL